MTDLVITRCRPVETYVQHTGPAGEALALGQYARPNATSGKFEKGNATTAGEAAKGGIVITQAYAAQPVTIVQHGLVDVGDALAGLDFNDPVYISDTDGTFTDDPADATVDVIIGRVFPGFAHTTADKLLLIDVR